MRGHASKSRLHNAELIEITGQPNLCPGEWLVGVDSQQAPIKSTSEVPEGTRPNFSAILTEDVPPQQTQDALLRLLQSKWY